MLGCHCMAQTNLLLRLWIQPLFSPSFLPSASPGLGGHWSRCTYMCEKHRWFSGAVFPIKTSSPLSPNTLVPSQRQMLSLLYLREGKKLLPKMGWWCQSSRTGDWPHSAPTYVTHSCLQESLFPSPLFWYVSVVLHHSTLSREPLRHKPVTEQIFSALPPSILSGLSHLQ